VVVVEPLALEYVCHLCCVPLATAGRRNAAGRQRRGHSPQGCSAGCFDLPDDRHDVGGETIGDGGVGLVAELGGDGELGAAEFPASIRWRF
jgi:hypothetical protein